MSVCKKRPTFAPQNRDVAQLVAHYVRDVGVGRSSRLIPTEKEQGESPAFFDGTLGSEPKAASSRLEKVWLFSASLLFLGLRTMNQNLRPHDSQVSLKRMVSELTGNAYLRKKSKQTFGYFRILFTFFVMYAFYAYLCHVFDDLFVLNCSSKESISIVESG